MLMSEITRSVFVSFGNPHNSFLRLKCFVDELCKLDCFSITVQAGFSKYEFNKTKMLFDFSSVFDFCSSAKFEEIVEQSDIVLGHAGVGLINVALKYKKYPAVMPRLKIFKEHVNNHQAEFFEKNIHKGCFHGLTDIDTFLTDVRSGVFETRPGLENLHSPDGIVRDLNFYLNELLK